LPGPVSKEEAARKLKLAYHYPQEDQTARTLDSIQSLLSVMSKDHGSTAVLKEAAGLISKHLRIREVAIGLRNPDGMYRFEVFVGYRPEAEAANRKLVYRVQDFGDSSVYKGESISRLTRAYFAEDDPYVKSEEDTYNRPMLLKGKRLADDETVEGDYFSTIISSPNGDLLGWIEIGGTTAGRLPEASAIKWIELVASILGLYFAAGAPRTMDERRSSTALQAASK